jgi:hypothetical protein
MFAAASAVLVVGQQSKLPDRSGNSFGWIQLSESPNNFVITKKYSVSGTRVVMCRQRAGQMNRRISINGCIFAAVHFDRNTTIKSHNYRYSPLYSFSVFKTYQQCKPKFGSF